MLQLTVVVKSSTLRALSEHAVGELGGSRPLNESEDLLVVTADTLRELLDRALPEDTRIDDVIRRLAV